MNKWLKAIDRELWIRVETMDSLVIDPIQEQDERKVQLFAVGTWLTKFANIIFFVGTHEECLGFISEIINGGHH